MTITINIPPLTEAEALARAGVRRTEDFRDPAAYVVQLAFGRHIERVLVRDIDRAPWGEDVTAAELLERAHAAAAHLRGLSRPRVILDSSSPIELVRAFARLVEVEVQAFVSLDVEDAPIVIEVVDVDLCGVQCHLQGDRPATKADVELSRSGMSPDEASRWMLKVGGQ
jgi:hypothetical protein